MNTPWQKASRQAKRVGKSSRKAQSIRTLCKHWREALGAKRG